MVKAKKSPEHSGEPMVGAQNTVCGILPARCLIMHLDLIISYPKGKARVNYKGGLWGSG